MNNYSLPLDLHINQFRVYRSRKRAKALVAGRGFGKSRLLLTEAITKSLGYEGTIDPASPKVCLIVMPTLVMARSIHWEALLDLLENAPFVDNIDRSSFRIRFRKKNAPDLILRGADRGGDRLRGLNLLWAGMDEYQDFHPEVWSKALFPALGRNRDWSATAIGTPKGKNNHFYKFCETAYRSPDWGFWHYHSADNPFYPRENLEQARLELPPRIYQQEHEASFVVFEGQYFISFESRHTLDVMPRQFKDVFIGADWGDRNPYLSVVGLTHEGVYYVIDAWEPENPPVSDQDIIQQAARLAQKWNVRRAFLPDDRPGAVKACRQHGRAQNITGLINAVTVSRAKPGVSDGLMIMDSLLYQNRLFINKNIPNLEQDFRSYHRAKDGDGLLLSQPAKGQRSHSIDSIRYCAAHLEFQHGRAIAA